MAQVDYSPQSVAILKQAGLPNTDIARLTDVNPSSITRLLQKIDTQRQIIDNVIKDIPHLLGNNIAIASQAIWRTLEWYNSLEESDFMALSWTAKKSFGDLANNVMGTSLDKQAKLSGAGLTVNIVLNLDQYRINSGDKVQVNRDKAIDVEVQTLPIKDNIGDCLK